MQPRRSITLYVIVFFAALISACAAILGLDPLDAYVEADGGDGALDGSGDPDASTDPNPDDPDASSTVSEAGSFGEAGTAPCEPTAPPTPIAVFVSSTFDAGASATGEADAPFPSIAEAVSHARFIGAATVVIEQGTYSEAVTIEKVNTKDIVLDGAWTRNGQTWTRDCSDDRKTKTVLRSTTNAGLTLRDNAAKITVANMTIESAPPGDPATDQEGASRYGVFVTDSQLLLSGVTVHALEGGPGGLATAGQPGARTCESSTLCTSTPKPGDNGPSGAAAGTFGNFDATGFQPANGSPGAQTGGTGTNGTPGGSGSTSDKCSKGCKKVADVGNACDQSEGVKSLSSAPGQCGCGGTGGKPGAAGRGGGASIGIYVTGSTSYVYVEYSDVKAENGGAGSPGGLGGVGGQPSSGAPGVANNDCWEDKCCRCGDCPSCGCYGPGPNPWPDCCGGAGATPKRIPLPGGAQGGAGMAGGKGANGGGGAGGPSFTYVVLDGRLAPFKESSGAYGSGGAGAGGAKNGPSGEKP